MNRPLRIQPLSVLLGLGVAALFVLTTSQLAPNTPEKISRVQYFARPQDMVQVHQGTTFHVPASKVFILTAAGALLGSSSQDLEPGGAAQIRANGVPVLTVGGCGIVPARTLLPFNAGTAIDVESTTSMLTPVVAWGYLEDAAVPPVNVLRVEYQPHPTQMIEIRQDTPFTVPVGRVFVFTATVKPSVGQFALLTINSSVEFSSCSDTVPTHGPIGLTARAGDIVEPIGMAFNGLEWSMGSGGRAWGYLADVE